jgi:glycosyltransferase involved in cell wall biosynthesis
MVTSAMVLTTIFDTQVLDAYYENFNKYGHLDSVWVILITDRKTPSTIYYKCQELSSKGLRILCPTVGDQESFLSKVGLETFFIPYDSDNRRNVGFLMALEKEVDFIVSIDDDNYCINTDDFFKKHSIVLQGPVEAETVCSSSGWYNILHLLHFNKPGTNYPRGFPYFARHIDEKVVKRLSKASIHINAGLWLRDPDVDAISWLVNPMIGKAFSGPSIVLDKDTWTPLNSQNTSLKTEVIAAYYYVKMNYPLLGGMDIDRYGDIFSGYFCQACMRHLGGSLRIGTPIVEHRRNSHNYLNDAIREMAGIAVLEDLLPWLTKEAKLEGKTYPQSYVALSYLLEEAVEKFRGKFWNDPTRGYFHQTAYHMRKWSSVCQTIMG